MAGIINLNDTTPAPPSGLANVKWQGDSSTPRNVSAYLPNMVGDSGSGGSAGAVPGSAAGTAAAGKFLKADGTWAVPPGTGGGIAGVSVKTADYTAVSGDAQKLLVMNSGSAHTITLPASPPGVTWNIFVQNIGAGVLTIARNGLNIDGVVSNLTIYNGQGLAVFTDGTNYFTERGVGFSHSLAAIAHQFLTSYDATTGLFTQTQPAEADLSVTDITTNNVSITAHGFAPKAPNDATKFLNGVGAYSSPPAPATGGSSYTTTFSAATSVTVTHNLSASVLVAVWDSNGNQLIPESMVITNSNVVTLTFGVAATGTVVVIASILPGTAFATGFIAATSVTVTHGLGSTNVIVAVWDSNGNQLIPETMVLTSANIVTLTFGTAVTGSAVVIAAGTSSATYITTFTAQTSVTVTHNKGTSNVLVNVWDSNGNQLIPESMAITSANVVTLTFGVAATGTVVVIG